MAKSTSRDERNGKRVRVINPKNSMWGETGTVTRLDRGNVHVTLDGGPKAIAGDVLCIRWSGLEEIKS